MDISRPVESTGFFIIIVGDVCVCLLSVCVHKKICKFINYAYEEGKNGLMNIYYDFSHVEDSGNF